MRAERPNPVLARRRSAPRVRPAPAIFAVAAVLLGALGGGGSALAVSRVGSEFQVSTYTTGSQSSPSVAVDPDGNFVVVWESGGSAGTDTSGYSIQGQRYDASGSALSSEFQVNTYTTDRQSGSSVAVDADGNFVVVWQSDGSAGTDTSGRSIQGQRYDASGNAIGAEFQVNTYTSGNQQSPSVSIDADGNFLVVWDGSDIQAQRYDASGNALGAEFTVNTDTSGYRDSPSLAMSADGDSVVVWRGDATFPFESIDIRGRRYDASGDAIGNEFRVNTSTTGNPSYPAVAVDADGGFVVVWGRSITPPGATYIQGRRYDTSGNAVGSEFQIAASTTFDYYNTKPSVAADADGGFVVVWTHWSRWNPFSLIRGEHYETNGDLVSTGSFVANTRTYMVWGSAVAVDENDHFVVVWEAAESIDPDPDVGGIKGQRFSLRALLVPSLSPPAVVGLALMLFGIAAGGLRASGRLRPSPRA